MKLNGPGKVVITKCYYNHLHIESRILPHSSDETFTVMLILKSTSCAKSLLISR